MAENEWATGLPEDVTTILTQLRDMEEAMLEKPKSINKGDDIAARLDRRGLGDHFNIVPGTEMVKCHPILLVAVGSKDKAEIRIFQAIEHIHNCSGITTTILFWAGTWDTGAWMEHANSFKNVKVLLKLFYSEPIRLK
jgi:hypothetical protein